MFDGQQDNQTSVSDRVRTIESQNIGDRAIKPVFPLHLIRFPRRGTDGAVIRPDTPLRRATADDRLVMHAPQATRSLTSLLKASDDTLPRAPATARPISSMSSSSTSAFTPGTIDCCARHGRKSRQKEGVISPAVSVAMQRNRSGMYEPVGLLNPRQCAATSPWAKLANNNRSTQVCPDCATEQAIQQQEAEEQSKLNRGQRIVIAREMPEQLQAIIFEQYGKVDRIVMNARDGPTVPDLVKIIDQVAEDLRLDVKNEAI